MRPPHASFHDCCPMAPFQPSRHAYSLDNKHGELNTVRVIHTVFARYSMFARPETYLMDVWSVQALG